MIGGAAVEMQKDPSARGSLEKTARARHCGTRPCTAVPALCCLYKNTHNRLEQEDVESIVELVNGIAGARDFCDMWAH